MRLDSDGVWVEYPLPSEAASSEEFAPTIDDVLVPTSESDANQLPPELPKDYIELLNEFPQSKTESATKQVGYQQTKSPRVRRLVLLPGDQPD